MKFYIVLFLVFIQNSFAQSINQVDEKGLKHGIWKGVYKESKRPRYEGTFEHGKETGLFKFFDDTKANTVIATRDFNPKDNSCYSIFYNQKGSKVSEGLLINKGREGEWKYYHFESDVIMTLENYKNDQLNGVKKVFYKSGDLAEETNFKKGLKDGVYKKIAENGVILEEINYRNDIFEGLSIFKNAKGELVSKGIYVNGKKEGNWQFLKKGKLFTENMSKVKQRKFVQKPITKEPN
jgi:antitoxin component YwqK of YwqJK toxin-antitoxin module